MQRNIVDNIHPFYSIPRFGKNEKSVEDRKTRTRTKSESTAMELTQVDPEQEKNNAYIKSVYNTTKTIYENDKNPERLLEGKKYSADFPETLKTNEHRYQVVEKFNDFDQKGYLPAMARVLETKTDKCYLAKVQMRKPIENTPTDYNIILRELNILASWIDKSKPEVTYLTNLVDCGYDDNFRFIVVEDASTNLKILQNSKEKMPKNFVFLATYQSFQAIKQLHDCDVIHCDLQPVCFTISRPFLLKVKNFYRACYTTSTKNLVNNKPRTNAYSSRRAHKIGEQLELIDDYENWFHVMMHVTCKNGLPWREGDLDTKEKFYASYESTETEWFGSADILCLIPYLLKKYKSVRRFEDAVDELFSINANMFQIDEQLDWDFFIPEDRTRRSTRKRNKLVPLRAKLSPVLRAPTTEETVCDGTLETTNTEMEKNKKVNGKRKQKLRPM